MHHVAPARGWCRLGPLGGTYLHHVEEFLGWFRLRPAGLRRPSGPFPAPGVPSAYDPRIAAGDITLRAIGHVRSAHTKRESTPTQAPYYPDETGEVVLLPEYIPGLRGLEGFDYLWVLAHFDRLAGESPRIEEVPHPLRGTGRSFGVFATRSPARPNNIGLSRVRILGVHGNVISFAGVDLMDGTPVLDLKPFMAQVDIPPEGQGVHSGWLDELER